MIDINNLAAPVALIAQHPDFLDETHRSLMIVTVPIMVLKSAVPHLSAVITQYNKPKGEALMKASLIWFPMNLNVITPKGVNVIVLDGIEIVPLAIKPRRDAAL